MRIKEILDESRYDNDVEIILQKDIRILTDFYNNFDHYVIAHGRIRAEALANAAIQNTYSSEWLTTIIIQNSSKLQKTFDKLQTIRNALKEKINLGV